MIGRLRLACAMPFCCRSGDDQVAGNHRHRPRPGRSETMLHRNALTPFWGNNDFTIEPAIDRFFTRAFDVPVWSGGANVKEFDDHAEITMDLPGVKPEQIQVTAEHRTITVTTTSEDR